MIRTIVIVGGGTAGWMTAACLAKVLGKTYRLVLVESDEIGTVGVGEATIPMMQMFNQVLGLNEDDFIRETQATFKLGIRFIDWKRSGESYFHPFGNYGADMDGIGFIHYWLRAAQSGQIPDYDLFNVETLAARQLRFGRVRPNDRPELPNVNYAFHFDASLYARFLRRYAEARGVERIEGKIVKVHQNPESGFVTSVEMGSGQKVEGDLFIDCSGFRGLLIEETLKTGYEDWSQWLPCDRAVAVPCTRVDPLLPYTKSTAREAGWQWRIPLQHRTGNGYVFCSSYLSEDEATEKLLSRLDGTPTAAPRVLRFTTGHRKKMWNKNVVAFGLASGFLEPLESTSIWLVQAAIAKFLTFLPKDHIDPKITDRFNAEMLADYTNIKDFLIAHYKVTEREDTPFWAYCKHMDIPDSLKERLHAFRTQAYTFVRHEELFKEASWFAVLMGQGLKPQSYHPVADTLDPAEFSDRMRQIQQMVTARVSNLPTHADFIAATCQAPERVVA